ncbi:MAG: tRNA (5-methylaminomethyl-2-thiouridine)(34)-methyltransferase MnmD [Bacteroidales bacterium]|nr:tRNA (5-methylaminomethyl-2-thiouridine)(34)-methyltransferase MnmD [Bacteroidales bacterium]
MKYNIITTADGSHTLSLNNSEESYHSVNGALTESMLVYIKNGLFSFQDEIQLNILEIGFGTGLNALLTIKEAVLKNNSIYYHAIEPYPVEMNVVRQLNYPDLLGVEREVFEKLHQSRAGECLTLSNIFTFEKKETKVEACLFPENFYNLIYFDLFNPSIEIDLWSKEIFSKIYTASVKGAVLVTYSVKGSVKRALKEAGFSVEKLQGPPGKREVLRAVKI